MKVIVCHPAQQHSYRLAVAAKKCGFLDKYITTVYYRHGSLTEITAKCLKGHFQRKAKSRCCYDLNNDEVIQFCEGEGLLKLLCMNIPFLRRAYYPIKYHLADRFARKVAAYAVKNQVDAVITYDDTSALLFEILSEKAPNIRRIMDVSAANTLYMRHIYERDIELAPTFADRLKSERAIVWDEDRINRTKHELESTQYFLVPSNFVRRSLQFSGIRSESIFLCPYGVSSNQFTQKHYQKISGRPIRFVYVGGVKELKGIYYLLEAFQKIPQSEANLQVVGKFNKADPDIAPYLEHVRFLGSVIHEEIEHILHDADVFIMPSLGEGLSLAAMEAAMCGLPLIVTENSGIADLMQDGRQGFVIPIQSAEAIYAAARAFIDDPERIETMGREAHHMAESFDWNSYYERMGKILKKIGTL